jgi:hypothetical protein
MASVKSYSDFTLKQYNGNLKLLEKNGVNPRILNDVIGFFDSRKFQPETRKAYLNALSYKFRDDAEYLAEINVARTSCFQILNEKKDSQVMSDRQQKMFVPWSVILEKSLAFIGNFKNKLEHRILVALYTLMEPVRADYVSLKLFAEEPSEKVGSYFVVNSERADVVINDYKSAKSYGPIVKPLPVRITSMLRIFFAGERGGDKILFHFSPSSLSHLVKSVFSVVLGRDININMLRHSFLCNLYKDAPLFKDMKLVGKRMGHSYSQALSYVFSDASYK